MYSGVPMIMPCSVKTDCALIVELTNATVDAIIVTAAAPALVDALTEQGWEIPESQANFVWVPAGERTAEGTVVLTGVQKDWLVRTAAGYAPEVKVLDPPEVRTDIINLLRAAANHNGAE